MSKMTSMFPDSLLSSGEAGRRFGYTKDYVSKLAREGKISATRVGRQWFVDEASLSEFVTKTEEAKRDFAERVRQERKTEFISAGAVKEYTSSAPLAPRLRPRALALIEAGTIMILGVMLGSFIFSTHGAIIDGSFTNGTMRARLLAEARNVYGAFTIANVPRDANTAAAANASAFDESREAILIEPIEEGASVSEVASSFSDEVNVEFDENGKSGIVAPVFRDASDAGAYRFMLVPLRGP